MQVNQFYKFMTPQQQTDLNLWKQDQSQPLPKSLANALIEDCLIELNKDQKGYSNFKNAWIYSNDTSLVHISMRKHTNFKNIFLVDIDSYEEYKPYYSQTKMVKVCIIQTLLSRTPDGQAVMPFLDNDDGSVYTLDHLLYREFTKALRVGKTFDEALKIINLIYCQNAQNKQN
jgi:anaerobic glycerol-3-phosphate dehydrogenase